MSKVKKYNREQLLDVFKSDIPGAVIISKDTASSEVFITIAGIGIRTWIGCVEFGSADVNETYNMMLPDTSFGLSDAECEKYYNDIPNEGTAWLVIPREKDYVWERIDHLLRFQNEDDYEDKYCPEDDYVDYLYFQRLNLRVGDSL